MSGVGNDSNKTARCKPICKASLKLQISTQTKNKRTRKPEPTSRNQIAMLSGNLIYRKPKKKQAQVLSPTACGALFSARTTPQPLWNPGGTLVEPWWNPRGTLPQGRPGPPRSLSGVRPQSVQLLGNKKRKHADCSNQLSTTRPIKLRFVRRLRMCQGSEWLAGSPSSPSKRCSQWSKTLVSPRMEISERKKRKTTQNHPEMRRPRSPHCWGKKKETKKFYHPTTIPNL